MGTVRYPMVAMGSNSLIAAPDSPERPAAGSSRFGTRRLMVLSNERDAPRRQPDSDHGGGRRTSGPRIASARFASHVAWFVRSLARTSSASGWVSVSNIARASCQVACAAFCAPAAHWASPMCASVSAVRKASPTSR